MHHDGYPGFHGPTRGLSKAQKYFNLSMCLEEPDLL